MFWIYGVRLNIGFRMVGFPVFNYLEALCAVCTERCYAAYVLDMLSGVLQPLCLPRFTAFTNPVWLCRTRCGNGGSSLRDLVGRLVYLFASQDGLFGVHIIRILVCLFGCRGVPCVSVLKNKSPSSWGPYSGAQCFQLFL